MTEHANIVLRDLSRRDPPHPRLSTHLDVGTDPNQ